MLIRLVILTVGLYVSVASAHLAIDAQLERLNMLIKATPENQDLFVQRGDLHQQHGDWQLALNDYNHAKEMKNSPDDIDLYIGRLWLDMNKAEKALPLFLLFTQQHPQHPLVLHYLGDTRFALKQFLSAALDYKSAIASQAYPSLDLFLKLAHSYSAAGENYKKDAATAIYDGINQLGPLVTLITTGIDLEIQQHNYKKALVLIEMLPKVVKNSPKWLTRRGDILQISGRNKEAMDLYNHVISKIEMLPPSRRNTREMRQLLELIKSNQNHTDFNTERSYNDVKHL